VPALYPAIDILEGRAVRLEQGDFGRRTEYAADPLEAARRWVAEGAARLHVVDLDGAREGRPVNLRHLERIASATGVPVQYGGGLRSVQAIAEATAAGASHVVVGTVAFTEPGLLAEVGDGVRVALDVRDGVVATSGWLSSTSIAAPEAVQMLKEHGVDGFVYTSVDRDGTMQGPDIEALLEVCQASSPTPVIYSGGIGSLDDLRPLASLPIEGVIVGKALYEGRFGVAEARQALGEGSR
jgi:phosphoribosylformimino-5-aminoimidazole carboxamide ribotide isomerase